MTHAEAIAVLETELAASKSEIAAIDARHQKGTPLPSNHYYFGGHVAGLNFALALVKRLDASHQS